MPDRIPDAMVPAVPAPTGRCVYGAAPADPRRAHSAGYPGTSPAGLRKNSAWGVFLSVAVSAVVGYVMLMIFTWSIPDGDVATRANDAYPVLQIVYGNLGTFYANLIAVIIGGAMWLCGLASITSMARMWYAFARDDGMPGSALIKQVSPRYRTPANSILITSALSVLICIYAAAYFVVTSISVITLYLAYMFPIYLNWRNKRKGMGEYTTPETAPWSLGGWGPLLNVIAIVWVLFLTVIFSLPPNELVLWTMLALTVGLVVLYWQVSAKRTFVGPTRADEQALRRLEDAIGQKQAGLDRRLAVPRSAPARGITRLVPCPRAPGRASGPASRRKPRTRHRGSAPSRRGTRPAHARRSGCGCGARARASFPASSGQS